MLEREQIRIRDAFLFDHEIVAEIIPPPLSRSYFFLFNYQIHHPNVKFVSFYTAMHMHIICIHCFSFNSEIRIVNY